ncbi:IS66 family transposase [Dactylosporangium sp. CA-233914]|uniref:IS66 family transposase n=1 Tax=Dactylosporangium sp. CA-233914 TaxID=3239934 RepID=UPI003D946E89
MELVEQFRRANAGLREVLAARDAQIGELQAVVHALGLQVAELQRRLGSGSDDSGTPSSKESIEAKARRKAERVARREAGGGSSRQRSKDKSQGGQPGHPGHGLRRDPDPAQRLPVNPPVECRDCGDDLTGAADAGTAWSQIWDVKILPWRAEYLLPRRRCACTATTTARPPDGGVVNGISFGPVLNTAAVALTAFGNVPTERASNLITILYGQNVSVGFVDRANARLAAKLTRAGFDTAMLAALMAEPVLTADESPVQVVTPAVDEDTRQPIPGSPHVLAIRTPDERLAWLTGLTSRSYDTVIAALRTFAGHLIVDGYGAYQGLLSGVDTVLAGIQQCCQHVMRRCRAVAKIGPGTLQSHWTGQVTDALTTAHTTVQEAKASHHNALDPDLLARLRERYDKAVDSGIVHNRHRDWHDGNHPGYTLATWLATHAGQVWHFTSHLNVDWTSNAAERGVKPAKRHQAVSGYWQTHHTLNRWCLINSYLTTTRNHGLTALDAITRALTGRPWLPTPATA